MTAIGTSLNLLAHVVVLPLLIVALPALIISGLIASLLISFIPNPPHTKRRSEHTQGGEECDAKIEKEATGVSAGDPARIILPEKETEEAGAVISREALERLNKRFGSKENAGKFNKNTSVGTRAAIDTVVNAIVAMPPKKKRISSSVPGSRRVTFNLKKNTFLPPGRSSFPEEVDSNSDVSYDSGEDWALDS